MKRIDNIIKMCQQQTVSNYYYYYYCCIWWACLVRPHSSGVELRMTALWLWFSIHSKIYVILDSWSVRNCRFFRCANNEWRVRHLAACCENRDFGRARMWMEIYAFFPFAGNKYIEWKCATAAGSIAAFCCGCCHTFVGVFMLRHITGILSLICC